MANGNETDDDDQEGHSLMAQLLSMPCPDWEDDEVHEDEENCWASETVLDLRDTMGPGLWTVNRGGAQRISSGGPQELPLIDLENMLQVVLLQEGVLEDQDPSRELGVGGRAAGATLREMRRTGLLGALSDDAQQALLGGTLFQYGDRHGAAAASPGRMASNMLPQLSLRGACSGSTTVCPSGRPRSTEAGLEDIGGTSLLSLDRLLALSSRGAGGGGSGIFERLLDTARSRGAAPTAATGQGSSRCVTDRCVTDRSIGQRVGDRADRGVEAEVASATAAAEAAEVEGSLSTTAVEVIRPLETYEASSVAPDTARSGGSLGVEMSTARTTSNASAGVVEVEEASSVGSAFLSDTLRSERLRTVSNLLNYTTASMDTDVGEETSVLERGSTAGAEEARRAPTVSTPTIGIPGISGLDEADLLLDGGSDVDEGSEASHEASLEETRSLWGLGDTMRSQASSYDAQSVGGRSGQPMLEDTVQVEVGESLTAILERLAIDGVGLDESLARSVRRVLQLGTVLTGQRLSDDEIKALPQVRFEEAAEQQCAICLEPYQKGELLTALRCSHFFHIECLGSWFRRATQCPLCRADAVDDVVPAEALSPIADSDS